MKKVLLSVITLLVFGYTSAQEKANSDYSKGYIGLSIGASFPGGDITSNGFNAGTGINIGFINAGYRFTENFGLTLNWGASAFKDSDFDNVTYGVGYFSVGPMFSLPIKYKFCFDFKTK